ncbi:alpha-glutamyl/putrescinyl thymine pyrophosphorylase clade 3 protein [Mesorhizobium sp. ORM6]
MVDYAANTPLPGIAEAAARSVLVEQLVESCRRVDFVTRVAERGISPEREDPQSLIFDPIRAAILKMHNGETDEAYWLIFLAIHFGRHSEDGWELVRNVYGRLGALPIWTWASVVADPAAFRQWMGANGDQLRQWRFGNHRKYESLSAVSAAGTPSVVESYIAWVGPPRTHAAVVQNAQQQAGHDLGAIFDFLYESMANVTRFGRLARSRLSYYDRKSWSRSDPAADSIPGRRHGA